MKNQLKPCLVFLLLALIISACIGHKTIPEFGEMTPVNGKYKSSKYTLLLYAAIGCGYSQAAIKKLQDYQSCDEFQIVVVEDDSTSWILEHQEKYFSTASFYSNEAKNVRFKNFFPQYFLYKNGKLIWRKKGYTKQVQTILQDKMNCQ